jgi:hypothetical protein
MSPILGIMASQISGHLAAPNSYESIQTVNVGSGGQATISFTSIPSTYKNLQVRGIARATSGNQYLKVQLNNDTGANYTYHELFGTGASAAVDKATAQTGALAISSVAGSVAANYFAAILIDVLDYTNTNKYKTLRGLDGLDYGSTGQIVFNSGLWLSTSAVTRLDLIPNASTFAQYSSFALYGIKG